MKGVTGMSNPIRVCLVGAGRVGKVHASSLVNHVPAGKLVGIVDPRTEALQDTGRQFGVDAHFDSLEAAVGSIDFEAVVITTPTFTHSALAVMAMMGVTCSAPFSLARKRRATS